MKRRRGRPADLYPTFPRHPSTLHTALPLHRFIPLLSIFIFTPALMSCISLCIPLLPLPPCHGIFYFFPLLQPLLHAVSPSALSLHSHSSALFTFHLSALTRLSAVLSSCCRGDTFTSSIVIESYEYFSPTVQLIFCLIAPIGYFLWIWPSKKVSERIFIIQMKGCSEDSRLCKCVCVYA